MRIHQRAVWYTVGVLWLSTTAFGSSEPQRERIVGLPCEGCEAVFDGMPSAPGSVTRLAPESEPGRPMVLDGIVTNSSGAVASGVIVYAYQTDAGGLYPALPSLRGTAARHGRLRGWARTDTAGRYRFLTVRPGGYPNSDIPEHIHLHVIEPGRCSYYIDDVVFEDDPRLTPAQRASHDRGRGGSGIVKPVGDAKQGWTARRDIRLGAGIPGYDQCRSQS